MRGILSWASRVLAGVFLLALGVILLAAGNLWNTPARVAVALACVAIGVAFLLTNAISRYRPPETSDPSARSLQLQPLVPDDDDDFEHDEELALSVTRLKKQKSVRYTIAGQDISVETISRFALMLSESRRFHGRITEVITPMRREVRHSVSSSLILDFPGTAALSSPVAAGVSTQIFYPMTTLAKGQLQDNFHVDIKGEQSTVTLTYEEYCQLMVVLIQTFVAFCVQKLPEAQVKRVRELSWVALSIICRRQVHSDVYGPLVQRARSVAKKLNRVATDIEDSGAEKSIQKADYIRQIAKHTVAFSDRYPLILVIPTDCVKNNRTVVKFTQDFPPNWCYRHARTQRKSFYFERIGALLGGRAGELDINLARAQEAQSYHVTVHGGDDAFLADQRILGVENFAMRGHVETDLPGRFRRPMGQSYFHGYYRDLERKPGARSNELKVRLTFYEVPPGAIGKATISALAALVLTAVVAILIPAPLPGQLPPALTAVSSFAALVLAFPAAAAAWVGLDTKNSDSILGTEITARISAIATLVLSLGASCLFLVTAQNGSPWPIGSFSLIGIDDWSWFALCGALFVVTIFSAVSWVGRCVRYLLLTKRSDDEVTTDIQLRRLNVPPPSEP